MKKWLSQCPNAWTNWFHVRHDIFVMEELNHDDWRLMFSASVGREGLSLSACMAQIAMNNVTSVDVIPPVLSYSLKVLFILSY